MNLIRIYFTVGILFSMFVAVFMRSELEEENTSTCTLMLIIIAVGWLPIVIWHFAHKAFK